MFDLDVTDTSSLSQDSRSDGLPNHVMAKYYDYVTVIVTVIANCYRYSEVFEQSE